MLNLIIRNAHVVDNPGAAIRRDDQDTDERPDRLIRDAQA